MGFFSIFDVRAAFLAISVFLLTPPAFAQTEGQAMMLPVDPAPLVAETAAGDVPFSIEIADEGDERARGLMFRQEMGEERGMLFVFENTRRVAFWMKNTPMPLDLVFIGDDGKVKAVLPGEPFSLAPISPGEPVRFVLELTSGTAQKKGIGEGDLLRHPAIDAISGE